MILYGSQTMDINSQHHNLLGNQISPKSEGFSILAAIFRSTPFQNGYQYKKFKKSLKIQK
jgi:hypothetical protein